MKYDFNLKNKKTINDIDNSMYFMYFSKINSVITTNVVNKNIIFSRKCVFFFLTNHFVI